MIINLIEPSYVTDEARMVASLLTAFAADPAVRWMYPDAQQFLAHFPDFVRAFAGQAFEQGTADQLEGQSCAALWLPPGVLPDDAAVADVLQRSVSESRLAEMNSMFEQMSESHPKEPHWHLPLIGVDPGLQGRGFGSKLLCRGLARCDADGVPAYLEATSLRSVPLYEQFGFRAVRQIKTRSSPLIIPMIRPARATG